MIKYIIMAAVLLLMIWYLYTKVTEGLKLVYEISHPLKNSSTNLKNIPYVYRRFKFQSEDGLTLSAIHFVPEQKPKGTIIVAHYLSGSIDAIYPYFEGLLAEGYQVAGFDLPNHGESGVRKSSKYTIENDMKLFVQKLKQLHIEGPYVTMGFSMGTTIAISAFDILPELKAIVVDSGPLLYVKEYFRFVLRNKKIKNIIVKWVFQFCFLYIIGFHKMSKRMIKRLKKMKGVPFLMIHCKRDQTIPYKNAEHTYSIIQSEKSELITVAKSFHLANRTVLKEKYDESVIRFLNRWFV